MPCGHRATDAVGDDNFLRWDADQFTCHPCAAIATRSLIIRESGQSTAGVKVFAVPR